MVLLKSDGGDIDVSEEEKVTVDSVIEDLATWLVDANKAEYQSWNSTADWPERGRDWSRDGRMTIWTSQIETKLRKLDTFEPSRRHLIRGHVMDEADKASGDRIRAWSVPKWRTLDLIRSLVHSKRAPAQNIVNRQRDWLNDN